MADIQTPDSIDQFRTNRTKLEPGARNVSVYQGGTKADVPEPPQTNSYSQLGDALSKFAGTTGVALTGYATKIREENDLIAGKAASEAMQKKNIQGIDEAVKQGLFPAGASPVFLQALRENQLGYAADKQRQSLQAAYWSDENADLRASNDPEKFNAFVKQHNESF